MGQSTRRLMMGAAGAAGGPTYVEDVFSTYLFNGNSGNQTITNGIDFAGEGGMVWCKTRGSGTHHEIADTERGTTNPRVIRSNETDAEVSGDVGSGFTSSGFSLGFVSGDVNYSGRANVSWSFRKAPGFFDIVTYTGNGNARTIPHLLGSVPGMIMVKRLSAARQWCVWHRNLNDNGRYLILNSHFTQQGYAGNLDRWNNQSPTATHLNIGTNDDVNEDGASYVAYVFAHDEQIFGDNEDQSIIKCGSYVGNGSESNGTIVNLGWEPQWLLVKRRNGQDHWGIIDTMRGWTADGTANVLFPNRINSEDVDANSALPTSTGFQLHTTNSEWNGNTETYIYMAIRRPDGLVGKPTEAATDVFAMATGNSTTPDFASGFPVDFGIFRTPASGQNWYSGARLISKHYILLDTDNAESNYSGNTFDYNTGWGADGSRGNNYQSWMWKRHAGMDVICYEGDGVNGRNIAHSMNDVPEMMIVKRRSSTEDWTVYHTGLNGGTNPYTRLITINSTGAEVDMSSTPEKVWKSTPTATHFEIGSHARVNTNGQTYLALLFSSIDGISKVGRYTGNAYSSGPTVTLGFAPRFLIIKGTSGGTNWMVYDTLRGLGSGNDKRLYLNTLAGQDTSDDIDPSATGFQVVSTWDQLNGSGQDYIYYAHA